MSVVTKEMLDAAVVFGRNQERERIIKLLEEHAEQKFADNFDTSKDTCHEDVCDLCAKWNGLGVAVALIKGENK